MSRDDVSLLAMQAAGMAVASIASVMGWNVTRATRRLDFLNAEPVAHEAAALDQAISPKLRAIAPVSEKPIPEGQGLVLRAFTVHPDGFGADCVLADGRRVFTVTGRDRQDPGSRIQVEPAGDVWRMVEAAADA